MSKVRKPKPKFGWTEEVALQHSEDVVIHPISAPFPTNDAGEAYIVQETTSLGVEIQPLEERHPYLPKERPGGRLEEILSGKARAPIAESPWASFAAQVVKFTGARRAMPSNVPGEIRVEKGDHYFLNDAQDSVYVGVPVT